MPIACHQRFATSRIWPRRTSAKMTTGKSHWLRLFPCVFILTNVEYQSTALLSDCAAVLASQAPKAKRCWKTEKDHADARVTSIIGAFQESEMKTARVSQALILSLNASSAELRAYTDRTTNSTGRVCSEAVTGLRLNTSVEIAGVRAYISGTRETVMTGLQTANANYVQLSRQVGNMTAYLAANFITVARLALTIDNARNDTAALASSLQSSSRTCAEELDILRGVTQRNFTNVYGRIDQGERRLQESQRQIMAEAAATNRSTSYRMSTLQLDLQASLAAMRAEVNATAGRNTDDLRSVRAAVDANLTSIAGQLNQSDARINVTLEQIQVGRAQVSRLESLQQQINDALRQRAAALGIELNSTKTQLSDLGALVANLRASLERLTADLQNVSEKLRSCPTGWSRSAGSCYSLVADWTGTWSEAGSRCHILGSDLASIESATENNVLITLMSSAGITEAWLGGNDLAIEGSWRWKTGAMFFSVRTNSSGYSNFRSGEPNNNYNNRGVENCLTVVTGGLWYDRPCALALPYFCEMYRP